MRVPFLIFGPPVPRLKSNKIRTKQELVPAPYRRQRTPSQYGHAALWRL